MTPVLRAPVVWLSLRSVLLSFSLACANSGSESSTEVPIAPGQEPPASAAPKGAASQVPVTDIVLLTIEEAESGWQASDFIKVTQREGYDNQPAFSTDGHWLYYTSVREDAQADIYAYEVNAQQHRRLTDTAVSEFSPTLRPNSRGLSLIREVAPKQWLWHHDLEGEALGAIVDELSPIGYHAWADPDHVALFIVDPDSGQHPLVLFNIATGHRQQIATGIGRCLQPVPGRRAISYVQTREEGEGHDIYVYDLDRSRTARLTQLPPGIEDYAWLPDGRLIAGRRHELLLWSPQRLSGWQPILQLAEYGVHDLSRIAVSSDGRRLAAVERQANPSKH